MNPFAKIDAAVLRAADAVVLAAWNRFSGPRIVLIRLAFVSWVIGRGTMIMATGVFNGWQAVWLFGLLAIGAMEEVKAARLSPRMQNARVIATRTSGIGILVRWFALTIPLKLYDEWIVLDLAASLGAATFFLLSQTLTPEEPPKRRQRQAALKPAGVRS